MCVCMYNKYIKIFLGQYSLVSFHLQFLCGCNILLAYLHGCQKIEIKFTQLLSNSAKPMAYQFYGISNCKPYTQRYDQFTIFLSLKKSNKRTLREVKVEAGHTQ